MPIVAVDRSFYGSEKVSVVMVSAANVWVRRLGFFISMLDGNSPLRLGAEDEVRSSRRHRAY